jgi:class 3 adenylate cyclase
VLHDLDHNRSTTLRPSADGPSELAVDLAAPPETLAFKPGAVTLSLSPAETIGLVRLERESWQEKGATASLVTTLQDFRDLFSSEVLAPGMDIAVRTVALLFTDLKGSTALYEKVGDAAAYSIVRDHFGYLFEIVKKHDGAVVKTIGDAVMAAFATPAAAVDAALEMQERVGELNAELAPKPPVVLKIGVHAGPSIAINADGILDYFGTTVNVAARVQNESAGGEVVLSEALARDQSVAEVLAEHKAKDEPFEANLKGLSAHFKLHRMWPRA